MAVSFVAVPFGLLIIVGVIVGLVMLVRVLPPGAGPKVALGVGGVLVLLAMLFVGYTRPVSRNIRVSSPSPTHFGTFPATDFQQPAASAMPTFSYLLLMLVGLAVLVGLLYLIYSLAQSSGGRVALGAGGLVVVLLVFMSFFYLSKGHMVESPMAVRQAPPAPRLIPDEEGPPQNLQAPPPRIDVNSPRDAVTTKSSEATINEPEPQTFTPDTNAEQPKGKPAWLTEGTQTGNGVSQFPVSSELYATVNECQKDLDSRLPAAIAAEVRYLAGEEFPLVLFPGEERQLTADTFTEEVTTSQGTWYKVHRLIKIDEPAWAMFRARFQQAQRQARLEILAYVFGGMMLLLSAGYLILRRQPRVVDPTLNTFSTT